MNIMQTLIKSQSVMQLTFKHAFIEFKLVLPTFTFFIIWLHT